MWTKSNQITYYGQWSVSHSVIAIKLLMQFRAIGFQRIVMGTTISGLLNQFF